MATTLRKGSEPILTRDDMVKILDLPAAAFRTAMAQMTDAERVELRRIWQEESVEAVASYNRYVEEHGLPLAKYRTF
jgi:antitoxin CcdA